MSFLDFLHQKIMVNSQIYRDISLPLLGEQIEYKIKDHSDQQD